MFSRVWLVGLVLGSFAFGLLTLDSDALAQNRKRRSNNNSSQAAQKAAIQGQLQQAQAQVAMARASYADAAYKGNIAQGKVSNAQQTIEAASGSIEAYEADVHATAEQLKGVEATIEAAQSANSPLAAARVEYEKAKQALETNRARVFDSPDYKQKYQQALGSADKATLLPKIVKEASERDPDLKAAQDRFELARQMYEQIRHELFQQDARWASAAQASREARAELAKAQQELSNGALHNASAKTDLRSATQQAAVAQATIQSGEAAIQKLQQAQQKLSSSSSSSNTTQQKKK
jgi:chromosome segregation ATPase